MECACATLSSVASLALIYYSKISHKRQVLKKITDIKYVNCEERERERKPTRCNNQMFIINTVSTCFGHNYAHLQENKDRVLLHAVCCAGSAGCGW